MKEVSKFSNFLVDVGFQCYKIHLLGEKIKGTPVESSPLILQCVPLATEPGISLIILPLMRILERNLKRTYLIV